MRCYTDGHGRNTECEDKALIEWLRKCAKTL